MQLTLEKNNMQMILNEILGRLAMAMSETYQQY